MADNKRYQPYSYVIKSGIAQPTWNRALRDTVQPSGMEVFGDLIVKSEINFNIDFSVESTGYTFYIFDADDEAVTIETVVLDVSLAKADTGTATENHAIHFVPAGKTDSALATDQGSSPYVVSGYWNDDSDGVSADNYNIGDEQFVIALTKVFTEALTASSSVAEDAIDISFVRAFNDSTSNTDTQAKHFYKNFLESFTNVYWTPANGTGAYTNDQADTGEYQYYVATSLGSVTATDSINVERILSIPDPSDTISVAEVAQISISFTRAFSDTGNQNDTAVIALNVVYADSTSNTDSTVLSVSKVLADSKTATEASVLAVAMAETDSATVSDTDIFALNKPVSETITNSEAINSINTSKGITETPSAAESLANALTKPAVVDSASATDTGIGSMQDYADPSYLSEDYVGTGWNFT